MGQMSWWQVMKWFEGKTKSCNPKSPEDEAMAEMNAMTDDEFFAIMETEIVEGEVISEDRFMTEIKKGS